MCLRSREPDPAIGSALTGILLYSTKIFMNASPTKNWSALIPIAMSLIALATVLGHIAIFGVTREADEGAAAHIWQLLMAGQVPVVAFYALKWLGQAPREAIKVLAVQAGAALAAMAPVYWLGL